MTHIDHIFIGSLHNYSHSRELLYFRSTDYQAVYVISYILK